MKESKKEIYPDKRNTDFNLSFPLFISFGG